MLKFPKLTWQVYFQGLKLKTENRYLQSQGN